MPGYQKVDFTLSARKCHCWATREQHPSMVQHHLALSTRSSWMLMEGSQWDGAREARLPSLDRICALSVGHSQAHRAHLWNLWLDKTSVEVNGANGFNGSLARVRSVGWSPRREVPEGGHSGPRPSLASRTRLCSQNTHIPLHVCFLSSREEASASTSSWLGPSVGDGLHGALLYKDSCCPQDAAYGLSAGFPPLC